MKSFLGVCVLFCEGSSIREFLVPLDLIQCGPIPFSFLLLPQSFALALTAVP